MIGKFRFLRRGIVWVLLLTTLNLLAQDNLTKNSVYKVKRKVEIPVTLGLMLYDVVGYRLIDMKPGLDSLEVVALNKDNIPRFDRIAVEQDPDFRKDAASISDMALNVTVALPALLMLDKEIREDWFDLLVLYGETHAINSALYIMGAGAFDRVRPLVYHPDVSFNTKTGPTTKLSFFSGHVSSASSASFFMAKVYSDYHPELGNKKYWLFGAAAIPPLFVGFFRVKAMKHFPTDVLAGTVFGAAVGILVPHFHKPAKEKSALSFTPITGGVNGFSLTYSIR